MKDRIPADQLSIEFLKNAVEATVKVGPKFMDAVKAFFGHFEGARAPSRSVGLRPRRERRSMVGTRSTVEELAGRHRHA